ncbi:zinc ribbon domain-containing protein [Nakamurella lactea]|uniref:zinc ribbon domain-containing protein n=1 Tax=Nakamurella lactea TaxID=459515 RepID=UPI00041937FF|nr:C4-type zinc ribbon domain-containing protein [Nakamurella lactea]
MPQADPTDQRRLLDIAATDRAIAAADHRRNTLPELALIAAGTERTASLRVAKVNAETEVADLERDGRKLDLEIDQVRARADRDAERMAAGAGPAKDLSNLQHEIDTLARRQATLEDRSLELMELREKADAVLATATADFDAAAAEIAAAESRRDDQFADLDDELARLRATRAEQAGQVPDDLLALYERIRKTGKIAAAELRGAECQACRLELDSVALSQIRSAPADQVMRCTECGAILVRG